MSLTSFSKRIASVRPYIIRTGDERSDLDDITIV